MIRKTLFVYGILMTSLLTGSQALGHCSWSHPHHCISEPFDQIEKETESAVLEVSKVGIRATRLFSGPGLYPPHDFAAYGILAFSSRASPFNQDRHVMLCHAYVASLPHTTELNIPHSDQIVTVWPIETNDVARELNKAPRDSVCIQAIGQYGLVNARQAINDAESTGAKLKGIGPHLLAWSPSGDKGKNDALVMSMNLSSVTTYDQALGAFNFWRRKIEKDRDLWENGWDTEKIRTSIQHWVDKFGQNIISILSPV